MAIDPKLVSIKEAKDLPTAEAQSTSDFLFFEDQVLKKSPMSNIYDKVTSGIKGVATTSTVPSPTAFERYLVYTAGTYTNFSGIVVTAEDLDVVNGVANNRVFLEVKDGVATKRVERVKGDAAVPIGEVNPDNPNAVSGSEVYDYIKENKLIAKTAMIDIIGSRMASTGVINSNNTDFKTSELFEVNKGDLIEYGVNVNLNPSSSSGLFMKYNLDGTYHSTIVFMKNIETTQFYSNQWIADNDCKLAIVTNDSINLGVPYLRIIRDRFVLVDELGNAIYNVATKPPILIEKSEPIETIGYYYNDGTVNTTTSATRKTDFILLNEGDYVDFGINGTQNASSNGAVLNIYDLNKNLVENRIKLIDHLNSWFEGSFTATQKCYIGISTTTTNYDPIKIPYVKSFKSNKLLLDINDIGELVPSLESFNILQDKALSSSIINEKTFINSGKKVVISGTSFSYPANGWFELMCDKLGVTGVNKSFSGERIQNLSARILNGTFFTQEILNDCDVLMIMHTHNKDVFTLKDIVINGNVITATQLNNFSVADYEDLNWSVLTETSTGWDGLDHEFAAVWDFVLKKIQTIYYEERNNPDSIYNGTTWGKPFNVVVTTNWHDGRVKFNDSIRKLAKKWGLVLCRFDDNIGFSRFKTFVNGQQHSIIYAMMKENGQPDTEVIDGITYAWHYARGQDKPLPRRMAAIAKKCFEII